MAERIGIEAIFDISDFNRGLNRYLGGLDRSTSETQGATSSLSRRWDSLGNSVLGFGSLAGGAALVGVGALTTAVAGLGAVSLNTAISFESAFTGVTKTIDGLSDSAGNLTELGKDVREEFVGLSTEIPLAFEELASIGEIGGQLGVGADAISDFTETVSAIGVSTNLSTEEAATGLARISNIFGVTSENVAGNVDQLGASIVDLGNNFATTERDVLAFAERIAGAGDIAGLSQADVLGIGAALSSVGVEAEAGGTAVQKVLLEINNAVNATSQGFVDNTDAINQNVDRLTDLNAESARLEAQFPGLQDQLLQQRQAFIDGGGAAEDFGRQLGDRTRQKALETALEIQRLNQETSLLRQTQGQPIDTGQLSKFAQVAGVSADEFSQLWEQDASQAFQLFVEGLGEAGDDAAGVLDDLGIADQRLVRAFLSLGGAGDLLGDAINTANTSFEDGTALADEAAKRYATTESQIQLLKNQFRAAGDAIGSAFLPLFKDLITSGTDFIANFTGPLVDAIENKILPGIEGFIEKAGQLAGAFEGGGGAGLVAALGLTPATIELATQFANTVTNLADNIINNLSPAFSSIGSGILPLINTAIEFLNENFDVLIGAIAGVGAVLGAAAISTIITGIVTAIVGLATPITALIAGAAALGAAWQGNWWGIRDVTAQVVEIVQATIASIVEVFQSQILPSFMAVFANITGILDSFGLTWGDIWNAVVTATQVVAQAIGIVILGIVGFVTGLVSGIAAGLEAATGNFDLFRAGVEKVITGIVLQFEGWKEIFTSIFEGDWPGVIEGAKTVFEGFKTSLEGNVDLIVAFFATAWETIESGVSGFIDGVIGFFDNLYQTLVGGSIVPDLVDDIIATFEKLSGPVLEVFDKISSGVGKILGGLFGGGEGAELPEFDVDFTSLLNLFSSQLPNALSTFQELFANFITFINETLATSLPIWVEQVSIFLLQITQLLTTFFQQQTQAISQFSTVALSKINQMFTKILANTQAFFQSILQVSATSFSTLLESATAFLGDLLSDFSSSTIKLADDFNASLQGIISIFSEFSANIISLSAETATGIYNAFLEIDWKELGREIIRGIEDGIRDKRSALVALAREVAQAAYDAAKEQLGVASPSKLFRGLGIDMIEGLALGIEAAAQRPIQAITDLLSGLEDITARADFGGAISGLFRSFIGREQGQLDDLNSQIEAIQQSLQDTRDQRLLAIDEDIEAARQLFDNIGGEQELQSVQDNIDALVARRNELQDLFPGGQASDAIGQIDQALANSRLNLAALTQAQGDLNALIDERARIEEESLDPRDVEPFARTREQQRLVDLLEQRERLEARITQFQERQSQLQFLQEQVGLINTINELGLNAQEILGGIQLGVNADAAAINNVLDRILSQVTQRVNTEIGALTNPVGVAGMNAQTPVTRSSATTVNINVGSINNGMDMQQFEARVRNVVGALG